MEYFEGLDLHSYQTQYLVELDVARYLSATMLNMMELLHSQLIIYRDLKPENILIDYTTGHLKLIDFGFAKQLSRFQGNNRTNTKCGTPIYTAPEILKLSSKIDNENEEGYGYTCDVWSWAVLLCELIGGYNPFNASDVMQIYENILKLKVNWPHNLDSCTKDLL